jgi:hypothetical protein
MNQPEHVEDWVEARYPYDGPYEPEQLASAALAAGRLLRYLNNATTKPSALPYAATGSEITAGVAGTLHHLPQLLTQLERFFERQADDPTLYDDRRDRQGCAPTR